MIGLQHMKSVNKIMDEVHSTGKVVVAKMVIAHILKEFNMKVHRTTAGRLMKRLGFIWGPIQDQPKSYAASAYRTRSIRDYIVALDKYMKKMASGDSDNLFIFTDESYVNINHSTIKYMVKQEKPVV